MSVIYQENLSIEQKLRILSDAAKYDVACTSSGVERAGNATDIGNSVATGICHSFAADGRCISLLKILFTNECIYDCKYCLNRSSNDVVRTSFTPEEVCTLTMEFYRRNYIEGLFLSSGILRTPNYTMEQIVKTLRLLREEHHFNGYIHCKAIPGADPSLVEMAGWYADRMSVNLELPTAEGLRALAPHKNRKNILLPMRKIQNGIEESQEVLGMTGGNKGAYWHTRRRLEGKSIAAKQKEDATNFALQSPQEKAQLRLDSGVLEQGRAAMRRMEGGSLSAQESMPHVDLQTSGLTGTAATLQEVHNTPARSAYSKALSVIPPKMVRHGFAPAGQSTQMIIGATPESDFEVISVAEALYQKFDLKRVFYSAFVRVNDDSALPVLAGGPPLLREHRMYQADWLLRYYGFEAGELLSKERPNFNILMDPKCNWAVGHLEEFPVEISTADYFTLLRVPGIGPKSARRIVEARKSAVLDFKALKKLGVVLKRALYFITCSGHMMYPTKIEETYIIRQLLNTEEKLPAHLRGDSFTYQQLSLFDYLGDGTAAGGIA
ncbi:MAG: putative DNA modification/repair radical SAM protein [Lachnospiraceae bacterium]|nr:putative DNA modification/repair radical SAM protein [Lachnospiraceae bacterium]